MNQHSHSNSYELRNLENEPFSRSYPVEETYNESKTSTPRKNSWRTAYSGWRGGVVTSITIASVVLLLNIILAIVAATKWDPIEGIATSYTGHCTVTARWTIGVHLVINLLSSLLLGASNYCMQRLAAPTRKEVDSAHAQRKWLDIGIPSIRNLRLIHKHRKFCWFLLALSSLPLHFLYNSAIFQTLGANQVYFLIVDEKFFTDKNGWGLAEYNSTWDNDFSRLQNMLLDGKYRDQTLFENLTDAECRSRYTAPFITSGSGFGVPEQGEWRELSGMDGRSSLHNFVNGSGSLPFEDWGKKLKFSYCLSQKVPRPKCSIQFSQTILHVVIACNVLKILLMIFILWRLNQETLVTVGDAINSFLQRPDPTTENRCLMSSRTVDRLWKGPNVQLAQQFKQVRKHRWGVACSKRRWGISLFLYFSTIIVTGILMGIIQSRFSRPGSKSQFSGFGKVNLDHLIDIYLPSGDKSVIPYILLANLPQVLLSFIYIVYNSQFTAMLTAREWSNYALKRAPLRVTIPSPNQRSTYYLQLPYKFSIPLILASIILHWFVSQSIFLVRIAVYKDGKIINMNHLDEYNQITKQRHNGVFSAVGYSFSALVASVTWGCLMVAVVLGVAVFGRYAVGMPVGGTNSAVVSAACHVRREEERADGAFMWGATVPGGKEVVGHCSFSCGEVGRLRVGGLYAGCVVDEG